MSRYILKGGFTQIVYTTSFRGDVKPLVLGYWLVLALSCYFWSPCKLSAALHGGFSHVEKKKRGVEHLLSKKLMYWQWLECDSGTGMWVTFQYHTTIVSTQAS